MRYAFRYQDFVDEQREGKVHGVFIDDTGSPGLSKTPSHLHPARKSWVAVIVPKSRMAQVWSEFPKAAAELRKQTGAAEFHFADIYMKRGSFQDTALPTRLAIFEFMADIFGTYGFPVLVQTLDPVTLSDVRERADFPSKFGPFNLAKHEDFALFFLLLRVKRHLEQTYAQNNRLARVFVDEGYKKNGTAIVLELLRDVFCDGLICFGKSDVILPLQLADFAAFCLNRMQLLIGKSELSELDMSFLEIIQPLVDSYQNTHRVSVQNWFANNPVIH